MGGLGDGAGDVGAVEVVVEAVLEGAGDEGLAVGEGGAGEVGDLLGDAREVFPGDAGVDDGDDRSLAGGDGPRLGGVDHLHVPLAGEQRVVGDEAVAALFAGVEVVPRGGCERAFGDLRDLDQAVLELGLDDLDERVMLQAELKFGEGGLLAEDAEQVLALAVEAGGFVGEAEFGQELG